MKPLKNKQNMAFEKFKYIIGVKALFSYLLLVFTAFNISAFDITWGKQQDLKLPSGEGFLTERQPIILNNDKIIEMGFKDVNDEHKYTGIYWIFSPDNNNRLKLNKKIDISTPGVTPKKELKKIYDLVSDSSLQTAYRGVAIPNTNRFLEIFFSWYRNTGKAIYRIATLNNDSTISWTKFKEFKIKENGEIYNVTFVITESSYLFGIISVSHDLKTEDYICYYNYGKIEGDKINWQLKSFNMTIPWAEHEAVSSTLKDSYILLCTDPATEHQKYSICRINSSEHLIFGDEKSLDNFSVTNEPAYIPEINQVIFPGEYKKNNEWVQAIACYNVDYKKEALTDKKIVDIESTIEFPVLTYLTQAKKLLLSKYYYRKYLSYIFGSITPEKK